MTCRLLRRQRGYSVLIRKGGSAVVSRANNVVEGARGHRPPPRRDRLWRNQSWRFLPDEGVARDYRPRCAGAENASVERSFMTGMNTAASLKNSVTPAGSSTRKLHHFASSAGRCPLRAWALKSGRGTAQTKRPGSRSSQSIDPTRHRAAGGRKVASVIRCALSSGIGTQEAWQLRRQESAY